MRAAGPAPKTVGDETARLAVLLQRWQLKPRRSPRWFRDLWSAFEEREPAACASYQRVSTLGVEMARLLDLTPWSAAAIRGSALLSALARPAIETTPNGKGRRKDSRGWEGELRGWRWLQACAGVLHGLQPGYDASQPLSRHSDGSPVEARILALAEDFEELTGRGGGVLRALRALRSKSERQHDPQLVELLWSEAGQAVCHRVLRSGTTPPERAVSELQESVRLLDRGWSGPAQPARRQPAARRQEKAAASSKPPAPPKGVARPKEDEERKVNVSKTTTTEEQSAKANGQDEVAGAASLTARIAAAVSEMEEIRAAASRGLEALASIGPAMEELSAVVSRLQTSLVLVQGGENASQAGPEPNALRSIALRVERAEGPLDVGEVADALDSLRDLRDLRVQDQGSSWAVLGARTNPDTDLVILQAKVAGSLTRRLGDGDGAAIEVTLLEDA